MVNTELLHYLKEGISSGHSLNSLKKSLIDSGWAVENVNDAASFISGVESNSLDSSIGTVNIPMGVKIVAGLHFLMIPISIAKFIISFEDPSSDLISSAMPATLSGFSFISIIPFFALLGWAGYSIYNGKNSWRIVAIVFGCLFSLIGLFSVWNGEFLGIINWLIALYIAGYLIFSKEGKAYFKK